MKERKPTGRAVNSCENGADSVSEICGSGPGIATSGAFDHYLADTNLTPADSLTDFSKRWLPENQKKASYLVASCRERPSGYDSVRKKAH